MLSPDSQESCIGGAHLRVLHGISHHWGSLSGPQGNLNQPFVSEIVPVIKILQKGDCNEKNISLILF